MKTNNAIRKQLLSMLNASYNEYIEYLHQFGDNANIMKNQRAYYIGLKDAIETIYNCHIGIKKDGTNILIPIEQLN